MIHARELVELAALAAQHGPALLETRHEVPPGAIENYWTASKCRLDRWRPALALHDPPPRRPHDPPLAAIIEEILAGEVLARVWGSIATALDRRQCTDRLEPIVRSVLVGHQEARNRVLKLLLDPKRLPAEDAGRLNALRALLERWTDVLLSRLWGLVDTDAYAVDPDRVDDFAIDLDPMATPKAARPLLFAALRQTLDQRLSATSPNPDLNARIAESVLAFFPAELLGSERLYGSFWFLRLTTAADEAQRLLESLL